MVTWSTCTSYPWLHEVHVLRTHGYMKYIYFAPMTWHTLYITPMCTYHTISTHISISVTSIRLKVRYTHTHTHTHRRMHVHTHVYTCEQACIHKHIETRWTENALWAYADRCTLEIDLRFCVVGGTIYDGKWFAIYQSIYQSLNSTTW